MSVKIQQLYAENPELVLDNHKQIDNELKNRREINDILLRLDRIEKNQPIIKKV